MTDRVYLHVGAPKSGTTYLQQILEANRGVLADAGVLVVGETHLERVHAAMVVREDPRLDSLPARAAGAWDRLVAEVRGWRGPVAVLSYELLAGASADQVARVLRDLDGIEVHVVITARDLGRSVPSAWQERLKFALTTPLERWRPRPESAGVRAEWGWRTMDPAGVAARWGAELPPARVHVVTVPTTPGDEHELWRRFAAACGIEAPGLRLDLERVNESMGLVSAELLRRVNEKVREPITGNREQALWLRDTLAHGVLAQLGREPIGLTDEQYADAAQRADAAVVALAAAGYDVRGDLEDLRATRPQARTPGEAAEGELLEVAVEAIVRLLLLVRERTHERDAARRASVANPDEPRVVALGKGVVRRITAPRVESRAEDLRARIAQLEEEVARSRELQLRVAELSDVVTELLLPPRSTDGRVTAKALNTYRNQSL
ncbi:DUF6752 domain-containing protein [Nocardioides sp. SYSU DS0663]|uniref:DUF6752 domain-containing protein n=1 Tax=Nocardioides sp. SYSU DS0663 TaxID=3416445 RepID=UPI003F4B6E97